MNLDNVINGIKSSFDQPGCAQYSKVESSLLKAMKGKDVTEEFEFVCALYKDDASSAPLKIHRNIGNSNISILLD